MCIIWAIGMVKNESDIIGYNLDHLFSQGISGATYLNNLSSDSTSQVLIDHGSEVIDDPILAYDQSKKMTKLAHYVAEKYGADWIIPVDADEIWYSEFGSLHDIISDAKENILTASVFNHFPTSNDYSNINPFLRMPWKWSNSFGPKVAIRYHKSLTIEFGNHSARIKNPSNNNKLLQIRHFPYRSIDQLKKKISDSYNSLKAHGVRTAISNYYEAWITEGDSAINGIWDNFYFPDPINDPITTISGLNKFGNDGKLILDPITFM